MKSRGSIFFNELPFDIPVPNGHVVTSPEEAQTVVSSIHAPSVIKAQVLAGGRGKGKYSSDGKGGVRIVDSPSEAYDSASKMLGYYLTTKQTPPEGLLVKKLYIYKAVDVAQEFYVALTFDREREMPVLLISDAGGVNIESNVNKLQRFWFHMPHGIGPEIRAYIQAQFGFSDSEMAVMSHILHQMVELFAEKDATLLELNPLVRTPEGDFVCLDAKFTFDNSARFRQKGLFGLEERSPEEELEFEASQLGLSYIKLNGNIGNIVNGAGLAMATNDLISLFGGECANFLDVGGGATKETLAKAFEILNADTRIKGILINIYGGIVRCDMIAESIIAAAAQMGGFKVPVVVRLQGTNCDKGLKLLENSGAENNITVEADFEAAAETIVRLTSHSKQ
ncbi:Succinate--CoA ligase subunit beta [Penicillium malachiteum]|uniref:Succinate--CoA ligase subunit beta n=1 Tax=Penicillium malachiteum TaxID=1324776 RepID=UPI002546FF2D|nr:Succinate--CoA ligase subunit beta [Penicillium malachiteum]KAJ5715157.1 Succinate--CoA ligase subunit beta [Penicillium malachiteum]